MNNMETTKPRLLCEIAAEIKQDWTNVHAFAFPYLKAMRLLETIDDKYGAEYGSEIVLKFLSNSQTWRGEKARQIKTELRTILNR